MDRELAAALAGELPAAANAKVSDAVAPKLTCPPDATGARFEFPDGYVTVILAEPGAPIGWTTPTGSEWGRATGSTGQRVFVVSEPAELGYLAPYADQVQRIATDLARLY